MKKKFKQSVYLVLLFFNIQVKAQFISTSFQTKVDFSTGAGTQNPNQVSAKDFDNDGKIDIASVNHVSNNCSVFKNISTTTSLNSGSLSTPNLYTTGTNPAYIGSEDIDGDGKIDIVTSNYASSNISVLRNISTTGTINFSTKVDYTVGANSGPVVFADIDGDGKKDLINPNFNTNFFSVHKNLSTSGSITLSTRQDFSTSGPGQLAREIVAADFNNDNKTDVAVLYYNGYTAIFKNTSTGGTISFTNVTNLTGVNLNVGISAGDLDNDGFIDLLVSSYNTAQIMVFKNSSTTSTISFNANVKFSSGNNPQGNAIIDLDGDNRPELVVCNRGSNNVSIFKNISTTGTINTSSFSAKVDYLTGTTPTFLEFADINDDGKKDLITSNWGANTISVLQNQVKTLILITDEMVHPLYTWTDEPTSNPMRLFDEPLSTTPSTEIEIKKWGYYDDISIVIDLGNTFNITDFNFFDINEVGILTIYSGSPSAWTLQQTFGTGLFNQWNNNTINITSRFLKLRLQFNTFSPGGHPRVNEINLLGYQTTNTPVITPSITSHTLPNVDDLMGINAGVFNKSTDLKDFKNVRAFIDADWIDGGTLTYPNNGYKFNPSYNDGSDLDNDILSKKDLGINIYPCIQKTSTWLRGSQSPEIKPVFGTGGSENPSSYIPHAETMYEFAGRYGNNTTFSSTNLSSSQPSLGYGLDAIKYIENRNEPNKWWGDPLNDIFFSPFELAAMSSADYDAHQGAITGNFGVNNADPAIKMVMGGLASLDLKYIKSMKLWADYNRNASGKGIFPADVLNFHHYSNPDPKSLSLAISPEDDGLINKLKEIVDYRNRYLPGKELWLSEFGYGDGSSRDGNPSLRKQDVPVITGQTKSETQANWLLRSFLAISASGFDKAMWFSFDDDAAAEHYANCGLRTAMRERTVGGEESYNLKPAFYYYQCMNKTLKGYKFDSDLSSSSGNANVMIYKYTKTGSTEVVYAVWYKTSNNSINNSYTFPIAVPSGYKGITITPNIGSGLTQCLPSNRIISISEKPIFIKYSQFNNTYNSGITITSNTNLTDLKEAINGDLTISGPIEVAITSSQIIMGSCSQIKVTGGAKLNIIGSTLFSCDQWKGIYVDNASQLLINNSTVKNALIAVVGDNPENIEIKNSDFDNNWLAIGITNNDPSRKTENISIKNNNFSNQSYNILNCSVGSEDIRYNFTSLAPSPNNYINFLNCAHSQIPVFNGSSATSHSFIANIENNNFNGIEDNLITSQINELTAVSIFNSRSISVVGNSFNSLGNEKSRVYRGIDAIGNEKGSYELLIKENKFNYIDNSIRITKYNNFWVRLNSINFGGIGVEVYNDDNSILSPFLTEVVCLISRNTFNKTNKAIIVAPKLNPFLAGSANNSLSTPFKQSVGIICNKFIDNVYGITGSGEIIDQMERPTSIFEFSGNEFIRTAAYPIPTEWDVIWQNSTTTPWNYNFDVSYSTNNVPNIYTGTITNNIPNINPSQFLSPTILNGVTVDLSNINNFMIANPNSSYFNCDLDPFFNQHYIYLLNQMPKYKNNNDSLNLNKNTIDVYPNPVNEILMIKGIATDSKFEILDVTGKSILEGNYNASMGYINVETLIKGIYLIKINYNNEIVTRKFVKMD